MQVNPILPKLLCKLTMISLAIYVQDHIYHDVKKHKCGKKTRLQNNGCQLNQLKVIPHNDPSEKPVEEERR